MARSFSSFRSFAQHLRLIIDTAAAAEHRAVDKGSEVLLEAVKAIPGTYQGEPTPWQALAESTIEDRVRKGFTPDEPLRRTGSFADSFEREVIDHRHAVVGSADERAPLFEYGTRHMAPRPVMGAADAQAGERVAHTMAHIVHNHLVGGHLED